MAQELKKLTTGNKAAGSTLTYSDWNEAVAAINTNMDAISAATTAAASASTKANAAQTTADEAKSLAAGAQEALSYADYETMITALETMSAGDLNIGQQILIVKSDVPDVWISANTGGDNSATYSYTDDDAVITALKSTDGLVGSWYTLRPLETGKVDLSDYYNKAEVSTLVSALTATDTKIKESITTLDESALKAEAVSDTNNYDDISTILA